MGFLEDVRRGAERVAKEAETATAIALKYAEIANLERGLRDVLADAARELLPTLDLAATSAPLSERAKALFEEARRLEAEVAASRSELEKLRKESVVASGMA
jgi:cell division protein FtsB